MILTVIDYGDLFYSSASKCLLEKLNVLKNWAIRIVCKLKSRSSVAEAANSLDLLSLGSRRVLHTLQFAYEHLTKVYSNVTPGLWKLRVKALVDDSF